MACFYYYHYSKKFLYLNNVSNVDPEQMPQNMVPDQGVHCLPMYLLRNARHKWVKRNKKI